jgi:outer membrane protein TolC
MYPNGPVKEQIQQVIVSAQVSMPLFLGDPTWKLAASKRHEADAARAREEETLVELRRDFSKARTMLDSLREQRKLAADDVAQTEEAAQLYYKSYKSGEARLIDVQNADTQALQAKVNAARVDAQFLQQMILLKTLSGKEFLHE